MAVKKTPKVEERRAGAKRSEDRTVRSIAFPTKLVKRAVAYAKREKVSVSQVMRDALSAYMAAVAPPVKRAPRRAGAKRSEDRKQK